VAIQHSGYKGSELKAQARERDVDHMLRWEVSLRTLLHDQGADKSSKLHVYLRSRACQRMCTHASSEADPHRLVLQVLSRMAVRFRFIAFDALGIPTTSNATERRSFVS